MSRQSSQRPGNLTIALVTVLYNCEKHLPLFFQSLGHQRDKDFIVVVIDNASKDHSLDRARELSIAHCVTCHFIANRDNFGIAVGNNQGIEWAQRAHLDHIVLINNDISCEPTLIASVRRNAIDAGHRAWTCLGYLGDSSQHWYGGGYLSYWRARGMHFTQHRSEEITGPTNVTYAPTCLMYLHASVFDDVGMMDPQYFVYYDDTDFCTRLHGSGIILTYDPTVSFRHYVGGSSGGELSEFFVRISTRNKFIYIFKHYKGSRRHLVTALAVLSKFAQLASPRLRKSTWLGLRDAFHATHHSGERT